LQSEEIRFFLEKPSLPSAGQIKKPGWTVQQAALFHSVSFSVLVSTLKIEGICFPETPLTFSAIHGVVCPKL
jgi:hypothetical protein